jgi:mono/diheme cytochrome c family protein
MNVSCRPGLNTLQYVSVVVAVLGGITAAQAQLSPSAQRGLTFARANCSSCHAIDKVSPSPLAIAPPLRTLHERYPVETLAEAFREGIVTGHRNMPEFRFDSAQTGDLINFLKSLE